MATHEANVDEQCCERFLYMECESGGGLLASKGTPTASSMLDQI